MGLFEFVVAVVAISGFFGVINNLIGHRQKIAELKLQGIQKSDQSLLTEIRMLKDQMEQLRDTTTQYDMSFDSALQRLESRVGSVEQRLRQVEQENVKA